MNEKKCDKLVFAVLQGDDYSEVVDALNQNGIAVTMLNSTGGFLRRKSVTVMIGVEHDRLEELMKILQKKAGRRVEAIYSGGSPLGHGDICPMIPTGTAQVKCGGAVAFITDLERMERY